MLNCSNDSNLSLIGLFNKSVFPKSPNFHTSDCIGYYSLQSDKIVIHSFPHTKRKNYEVHENSINNLKNAHQVGQMNNTISKKIIKLIKLWQSAIDYNNTFETSPKYQQNRRLVFLTLTLPSDQKHDDQRIKKDVFFRFIEYIQVHYGIKYYLWRAERQKNGNIHFHMIVDKFLPYLSLRQTWNNHLEKLGYISEFEKKHNSRNPNSTDIAMCPNSSVVASYIAKYIVKHEAQESISGHTWGCSRELLKLKPFTEVLDSYVIENIKFLVDKYKINCFADEYFSIIPINQIQDLCLDSPLFYEQLKQHSKQHFSNLYNMQPDLNIIGDSNRKAEIVKTDKDIWVQCKIDLSFEKAYKFVDK